MSLANNWLHYNVQQQISVRCCRRVVITSLLTIFVLLWPAWEGQLARKLLPDTYASDVSFTWYTSVIRPIYLFYWSSFYKHGIWYGHRHIQNWRGHVLVGVTDCLLYETSLPLSDLAYVSTSRSSFQVKLVDESHCKQHNQLDQGHDCLSQKKVYKVDLSVDGLQLSSWRCRPTFDNILVWCESADNTLLRYMWQPMRDYLSES